MSRDIKADLGAPDKEMSREQSQVHEMASDFNRGLESRRSVLSSLEIHSKKLQTEGLEDVSILEAVDRTRTETDPWLIWTDLSSRRESQSETMKNMRITMQKRQDMYQTFEAVLVSNLKKALDEYLTGQACMSDRINTKASAIKQQLEQVDAFREFELFKAMNPSIFVPSAGAQHGEEALQEPISPLLSIVHHGPLALKKTGVIARGWKEYQAILTGTGYIHFYDPEHGIESAVANMSLGHSREQGVHMEAPQVSICLSDCNLLPHPLVGKSNDELELDESRRAGIFGRGSIHNVRFKFIVVDKTS